MTETEFEYIVDATTDKRKFMLEISYQLKRLADAAEVSNNVNSALLTEKREIKESLLVLVRNQNN